MSPWPSIALPAKLTSVTASLPVYDAFEHERSHSGVDDGFSSATGQTNFTHIITGMNPQTTLIARYDANPHQISDA
jgi:hypothetical protein